jgi:hypothetical protein
MPRVKASTRKVRKLWEEQRGLCHWCGKECYLHDDPRRFRPKTGTLSGKAATLDHLYAIGDPRRRLTGGKQKRFVMACSTCNGKRGKKTPEQFQQLMQERLARA